MKPLLAMALVAVALPFCMHASERPVSAAEVPDTNVISRCFAPEEGGVAELSQGGSWLEFRHTNDPSGWGHRLSPPQGSVFVTNGLIVTLPSERAFEAISGECRNVIRLSAPPDVAWGKTNNGLVVGIKIEGTNVIGDGAIQLKLYYRNAGSTPIRVFACQYCPQRALPPGLRVLGPNGKVVKGVPGKVDFYQTIYHPHATEFAWPALRPGETVGPLVFRLFTKGEGLDGLYLWFDCARRGKYQVSVVYPPIDINADTWFGFGSSAPKWEGGAPSAWYGTAMSGTIMLVKP